MGRQSPLFLAALGLLFVSGFAALVYQVLWLRELGVLFGATAQAAASTIAVFFAGIAAGGWFWGRHPTHDGSAADSTTGGSGPHRLPAVCPQHPGRRQRGQPEPHTSGQLVGACGTSTGWEAGR